MARVSYAFPLKYNPPAMRVARRQLYKKSPFRYNRGVQATIKEGKGDFNGKANEFARTYEVDV